MSHRPTAVPFLPFRSWSLLSKRRCLQAHRSVPRVTVERRALWVAPSFLRSAIQEDVLRHISRAGVFNDNDRNPPADSDRGSLNVLPRTPDLITMPFFIFLQIREAARAFVGFKFPSSLLSLIFLSPSSSPVITWRAMPTTPGTTTLDKTLKHHLLLCCCEKFYRKQAESTASKLRSRFRLASFASHAEWRA